MPLEGLIRIKREKYDYVTQDQQYLSCDLDAGNIVEAEYVRSPVPEYQGNPFIEALPLPWTEEETVVFCKRSLMHYNGPEERALSKNHRIMMLERLREVRVVLPFQYRLQQEMLRSLYSGYSRRFQIKSESPNSEGSCAEVGSHTKLISEDDGDANIWFTVCGEPGTGKSSALRTVLKHIPQMIRHSTTKGKMLQIVYLVVTCPANNNVTSLLCAIGAAVDKLTNTQNYFENKIARHSTKGGRELIVRQIIENFAIGLIIFDEIQEMSFANYKDSFNTFVTISGRSRVALGLIGTEEAKAKVCSNKYIARRCGIMISADSYCADKKTFRRILNELQRYQWIDEPVYFKLDIDMGKNVFTDPAVESLYKYSHGIVDRLVSIYIYMQFEKIQKPAVAFDDKLIKTIVDRYYAGLEELYKAEKSDPEILRNIAGIFDKAKERQKGIFQKLKDQKMTDLLEKDNGEVDQLRQKVITNIQNCSDIDEVRIERAFDRIFIKEHIYDERAITRMVMKALNKPDRKPAKKKTDMEMIERSLAHATQAANAELKGK